MADVEMLFGVSTGGVSGDSAAVIKGQLENIIKGIEPLNVLVQADGKGLNDFKAELDKLTAHAKQQAAEMRSAYNTALSGIQFPKQSESGGNEGKGGSRGKTTSVLEKDTTSYYKAITRLEKMQTSVRENLRKWSQAENGTSSGEYKNLELQEKRLVALGKALDTGKLKSEQFEKFFSKVTASVAASANEINLNEENQKRDVVAYKEATAALKEYYKAQTEALKYRDQITYNNVSNEWETQDANLTALVRRLNETKSAFIENANVAKTFAIESRKAFSDEVSGEVKKYNEAVQAQNRKDSATAAAKVESDEAKLYKEATAALKEYYKAQTEALKYRNEIRQNDNGTWETDNANLSAFVERLNNVTAAYNESVVAADKLSAKNKELFDSARAKEAQAFNEAVQAQDRKDDEAALKRYSDQLEKVNTLLAKTKKNLDDWGAAKTGKSSDAYRGLEQTAQVLEEMQDELLQTGAALKDFDNRFDNASASAKSFSTSIEQAGENVKSVKGRIGELMDALGVSFTFAEVFHKAIEIGQKMLETVTEVDTAMTELRKVTDEADSTYTRFLENAKDRAHGLGVTVTDVVNSSADFARLGFSISEATDLSDAAIVYKNVGDGINDISEATESIISTMQAFNVEASDAMTIVDYFNKTGNEFAISSGGVGDALSRSAAALAAGNNTLEESVAMIAATNTTIQNTQVVGTAMKSISMFLRASKTEAEEAGESTEGMANSVSELRSELLALTGQKVDIQLNENEFKSTYQIMKEIAGVWDQLTDVTQANILELIGGKRNANVTAALIENFDIAEKAMIKLGESSGSALAENEKYLDSVAGKIAQLHSSLQSLSTTVLSSDLVKWVVSLLDALTRLATVISDVAFDNFFTTLSTLAVGGGAFKLFKDLD